MTKVNRPLFAILSLGLLTSCTTSSHIDQQAKNQLVTECYEYQLAAIDGDLVNVIVEHKAADKGQCVRVRVAGNVQILHNLWCYVNRPHCNIRNIPVRLSTHTIARL